MDIVSDKRLLKSIKEGLSDLKSGRYQVYKSVKEMKKDFRSTKKTRLPAMLLLRIVSEKMKEN